MNGLALAGIILAAVGVGVCALARAILGTTTWVTFVFGVAAVTCGAIGQKQASRDGTRGYKLGIAAIVLGLLEIVAGL